MTPVGMTKLTRLFAKTTEIMTSVPSTRTEWISIVLSLVDFVVSHSVKKQITVNNEHLRGHVRDSGMRSGVLTIAFFKFGSNRRTTSLLVFVHYHVLSSINKVFSLSIWIEKTKRLSSDLFKSYYLKLEYYFKLSDELPVFLCWLLVPTKR